MSVWVQKAVNVREVSAKAALPISLFGFVRPSRWRAMPKFVILDPSIVDRTGHYLEYAKRVLGAAKDRGLEPVLVTNRRFSTGNEEFQVLPTFSHTFWELYEPQRGLIGTLINGARSVRRNARRQIARFWRKGFLNASLTRWSLAYERARVLKSPADPRLALFSSEWTPKPSNLNLVRALWVLHWLRGGVRKAWIYAGKTYQRLPSIVRMGVHAVKKFATLMVKLLLGSVVALLAAMALIVVLPIWFARPRVSAPATFYRELRRSLHSLKLERGDIVFVPTSGEMEAALVSKLCTDRRSIASQLSWRLLFRREILRGREPTWQAQLGALEAQRLKMTLAQAVRRMRSVDVRWLTDTESLTRQHNLLGVARFETAPVPVSAAFEGVKRADASPVTFGYLGDARTEKGFGLLSEMWDHVVRSAGELNPPRLLAQSNYNILGGEPLAVQGRLALQAHPRKSVELVEGPFSSEEYLALFGQIDVMVVPYEPNSYATRSSGVFVEAIKGGMPAIVTNASWMAQLVEPYRQAWLRMIEERLADSSRVVVDRALGRPTIGELGTVRWRDRPSHLLFCLEFARAAPAHSFGLLFTFLNNRGERLFEMEECGAVTGPTVRLMTPLPKAAACVKVRAYAKDLGTSIVPLRVTCASANLPSGTPSSFGVRSAASNGVALAHAGIEILSCLEAYREGAKALQAAWREYFDDATLLASVIDGMVVPPGDERTIEIVAAANLQMPEIARPKFGSDLVWEIER